MKIPNSYDFQRELDIIFKDTQKSGKTYIDANSGDLHRRVGGYPGKNHRMPLCCEVLKKNMRPEDQVLEQPFKGKGASLIIRYKLPR